MAKEKETEKKMERQEQTNAKTIVVPELPSREVRKFTDENGRECELITISEALTEILEHVRILKKSLA